MADNIPTKKTNPKHKQQKIQSTDHIFRKRALQKPQLGDCIIYVSTKSSIKSLLDRCSKLINEDKNEIVIYCLGAAVKRGILLALQLSEKYPTFKLHTNTLTSELIDDLEPAADDADYEIQRRFNSALRITVIRSDNLLS